MACRALHPGVLAPVTSMAVGSILALVAGVVVVVLTLYSAIATFVLARSARSVLTRVVFQLVRLLFAPFLHFANSYERRDSILAYYAPFGLMLLLPTWYALIALGYALMFMGLGAGDFWSCLRLSGSSLFTLGFSVPHGSWMTALSLSEAMFGLLLVALLIAYLPAMYAAFTRRERDVNMLEVRAGAPPTVVEMLQRYQRIHGLDQLGDYWKTWEVWFAGLEESHTTLAALVFFRSPRSELSWLTAAGAVLDTASLVLAAVDIPNEVSAALCIRAGFLALRRIANYFGIPNPQNPHYPENGISVSRAEFDEVLAQLDAGGLPIKADRDRAWMDFAGWRVNYDRSLTSLCNLVMAPYAPWSSDRYPARRMPRAVQPK